MDPEKIKQWFETEAGKKFYASLVGDEVEAAVATKLQSGEFVAKGVYEADIAKAVANTMKKADSDRELDKAVDEIHALHPVTPKSAIRKELEQHEHPDVRKAHVDRMKAVAERNAGRTAPAPKDDDVDPGVGSVEDRFQAAIDKGLIAEPADKKEYARKLSVYKKTCAAYGVKD